MTEKPTPSPSSVVDASDLAARQLCCKLCRQLYELGWASGTGGGFSLRQGERVYIAPSAVPKESIQPSEIYVTNLAGEVQEAGTACADSERYALGNVPGKLKLSACAPLFLHAYQLRGAGAVLHSHSQNACVASLVFGRTFRVRGLEMVKGIEGGHVDVVHEVPIIDNTPYEHELADSLRQAIIDYPAASAVLVRGHGVYVWGRDWVSAKTQAECYDYLFGAAVRLHQLGLDPGQLDRHLNPPAKKE